MTRSTSFPAFTPTSGTLIRWCAEQWGDAPFVVLGDDRLTYAEAEARSADLAKGMLASGVGKGTHVGLLAPNGPEWVVAWLAATRPSVAIMSAGATNPFGHPASAVLARLAAAGAHVWRTDHDGEVGVRTDGRVVEVRAFTGRSRWLHAQPR